VRGTVKWRVWVNQTEGMITPDDGSEDVAFSSRDVENFEQRLLPAGTRVEYELAPPTGPKAASVKHVEPMTKEEIEAAAWRQSIGYRQLLMGKAHA
jgi:cold shock CspA family protein